MSAAASVVAAVGQPGAQRVDVACPLTARPRPVESALPQEACEKPALPAALF